MPPKTKTEPTEVERLTAENLRLSTELEEVRAQFDAYKSREQRHDRRQRFRDNGPL